MKGASVFRWVLWGCFIVLCITGILYWYRGSQNEALPSLATVGKRDIAQVVSETGNVKAAEHVDLAFQTSGLITTVTHEVGDHVLAGSVIATLDSSELATELVKAQADLGTQQEKTAQDEVMLHNSYTTVVATLNSSYTSANDAIRIKIDPFFTNSDGTPRLSFLVPSSQNQQNAESERFGMNDVLAEWVTHINMVTDGVATSTLEHDLAESVTNLNNIEMLLNILNNLLSSALNIPQSTVSTYKTYITSARTEIDTALSATKSLQNTLAAEKAALAVDLASEKSYAAEIDTITAKITQTTMRAPFSGVVTKQDAKVGETATANAPLTSIISDARYEIDVNVPEVDIAKVHVGDQADVTLDAYGNTVVFHAVVTSIDPAETMVEGVATYLTKFHFLNDDVRIRPGMTANVDITSAIHKGVLAVPERAIHKANGKSFVTRFIGENAVPHTEEVEVSTGLRSEDGYTEILNGLHEGDRVVLL